MPEQNSESPELAQLEAVFCSAYDAHATELEREHPGEYIVINTRSGDYVIGATPRLAMARAEQAYGSTDYCWSRRIGRS